MTLESRTKSAAIKTLLDFDQPYKNFEIALTLSPQTIIDRYEHKTASLDARLSAIKKLLDRNWRVGIRFLPLLPVEDFEQVYGDFLLYVKQKIDLSKVSSISIGSLLYTNEDYNNMLKKYPSFDMLYRLAKNDEGDNFVRFDIVTRKKMYDVFQKHLTIKDVTLEPSLSI